MKSFDFYDTIFVRLVADPSGVFQLVERMMDFPGFSMRRKTAERIVTARLGSREITLSDIYSELNLGAELGKAVMELELRLEASLLSPIVENLDLVTDSDIVVSDMYLPEEFFQGILAENLPLGRRPKPVISSAKGMRKSDGKLWQHIIDSGMKPSLHVGDNRISDYRQPRRFGIAAQHYRTSHLNRFEKRLQKGGLNGSLVAGVARATRLSAQIAIDERCIWGPLVDAFASVFSPVIFGFVEFLIADAIKRGIQDIFFLARDGQILFRIAEKIIDHRSLPLRAHYIYASRQALHMAGYTSPQAAASWLLEDTPDLSISIIAARANLPLNIFLGPARELGIHDLNNPVPHHLRIKLINLIENEDVAKCLQMESERQWKLANLYFRSAGFLPESLVAIVDVGWNGRIQNSLQNILARDGLPETTMVGYYLCLSSKVHSSGSGELVGFLYDPDVIDGACPFDAYRPVIEASLFADHGSTRGYTWDSHTVVADLEAPPAPSLRKAVLRQQDVMLNFAELLLKVESITGHQVQWDCDALRSVLMKFLRAPSGREARAFFSHEIDIEQTTNISQYLLSRDLRWYSITSRKSLGQWPEGSLALSGRHVGLLLIRVARYMHNVLKRRAVRSRELTIRTPKTA